MQRIEYNRTKITEILKEQEMETIFPTYLMDLLAYNGYITYETISSLEENEIKQLESFGRDILPKLLSSQQEKDFFFGIFSKETTLFYIVAGDRKTLEILSEKCKLHIKGRTKLGNKSDVRSGGSTGMLRSKESRKKNNIQIKSFNKTIFLRIGIRVEIQVDEINLLSKKARCLRLVKNKLIFFLKTREETFPLEPSASISAVDDNQGQDSDEVDDDIAILDLPTESNHASNESDQNFVENRFTPEEAATENLPITAISTKSTTKQETKHQSEFENETLDENDSENGAFEATTESTVDFSVDLFTEKYYAVCYPGLWYIGRITKIDAAPKTQEACPSERNQPSTSSVKPTITNCFKKLRGWDINSSSAQDYHYRIGKMIAVDNQPFSSLNVSTEIVRCNSLNANKKRKNIDTSFGSNEGYKIKESSEVFVLREALGEITRLGKTLSEHMKQNTKRKVRDVSVRLNRQVEIINRRIVQSWLENHRYERYEKMMIDADIQIENMDEQENGKIMIE
ncbi:unnamed protein product [Brassicogethes aeneus]|uniref:Uncharacterized protein n=1 Tax=Brassicogethes aeneus TaxID=1431903 RepID=A0A9P0FMA7_BRAAE|nr:unnamed protein product [Brassicogethes aeneus]